MSTTRRRFNSLTASLAELKTEFARLAEDRDFRYFTFYMGVVPTMGSMSAGESIRRYNAAHAAAAEVTVEAAQKLRETYTNLILPSLPDNFEGKHAMVYAVRALAMCPKTSTEGATS